MQIIGKAYSITLEKLQQVEGKQSYSKDLLVDPIKPLFKAR
jgi:hypothetical protein